MISYDVTIVVYIWLAIAGIENEVTNQFWIQ
jgi:hypothetical protein